MTSKLQVRELEICKHWNHSNIQWRLTRHYISLMDVAQNLIHIHVMPIRSHFCLLEPAYFSKVMLAVIYIKIYHSFILTIYENFQSVLHLSRANENLEIYISVSLKQIKELKQQFWGTVTEKYFEQWALSQKCRTFCSVKITTCSPTILTWQ